MALTQASEQLSGETRQRDPSQKPRVVFVDDEKRVLNAMKALFRRDYELFLTTSGNEAIRMCVEHDADVIVADQRMPEMEGVEVLGAVREQAPRTMRILLTGYADLDAIEGSINVGEVFRFLSKPCPPEHLRATIELAVEASDAPILAPTPTDFAQAPAAPEPETDEVEATNTTPDASIGTQNKPLGRRKGPSLIPAMLAARGKNAETAPEPEPEPEPVEDETAAQSTASTGEQVILSGDSVQHGPRSDAFRDMEGVGVVVFTLSDDFFAEVKQTLGSRYKLYHANRLIKVLELIMQRKAGVLISEVSSEGSVLRKVLNKFKQHLPELIAIVISDDRDAAEMISLINHGQVFRYMSKPVAHDRLLQNVNGGALRHLQMRADPSLIPRMQVETSDELDRVKAGAFDTVIDRIKSLGKFWRKK
ncbi:MAG: response regulator [Pseudomonadota bacterium]